MRAVSSRFLLFAACLGLVGCGGVEGVDGFPDDADETWASLTETSEPLSLTPPVVGAGRTEDGRDGRPVVPGPIPTPTVGGSSPDPIPARQAVSAPVPDRRFDFQFPECEPFPAGLWRDACNRSLGGRGR